MKDAGSDLGLSSIYSTMHFLCVCSGNIYTGCVYLGDPCRVQKRVVVIGVTEEQVMAAENDGTTPKNRL